VRIELLAQHCETFQDLSQLFGATFGSATAPVALLYLGLRVVMTYQSDAGPSHSKVGRLNELENVLGVARA